MSRNCPCQNYYTAIVNKATKNVLNFFLKLLQNIALIFSSFVASALNSKQRFSKRLI